MKFETIKNQLNEKESAFLEEFLNYLISLDLPYDQWYQFTVDFRLINNEELNVTLPSIIPLSKLKS